ncbi:histidine phosphatase family protein [Paracrocinitomix mangrovi]|uniref:SixA phosphatase family protein n=1 Tax=Paracrocinitomix mangrovi TaxID=2862509 RepID=UPI001C8DD1AF|nr:histidine phosphatase family protein [Paracrocinitomix mangrovi]UKN03561.1 histidine phosphatase family protein [Paracrocinitomix mangrovi]
MLHLYLLRHGKAANPASYDVDYDRPLNKKGIAQINQIGFRLKQDNLIPHQIISSSAKRTEETTATVNHYLEIGDITFLKELYLAKDEVILHHLVKNAEKKEILYVGHNFGISNIASYFSGETISMSTGMLVHFTFEVDKWEHVGKDSGIVKDIYIPDVFIP